MWVACRLSAWPRGSMTISFAPRFTAFLMNVAATGWLTVGLAPMTTITSEFAHSANGAVTAPEPIVSSRAATDEAWQSRVQWSTLLPPNPVRTSFWNRYASSFDPFAEPNPASARPPMLVADPLQARGGRVERLVPGRLAEVGERVGRIDPVVRVLGHARLADQGASSAGAGGGRSRTRTAP